MYEQRGETLKILEQTGKIHNLKRDAGRISRFAGKRISKNGLIYWETRKNRSDAPNSNV